MLSLRPNIFKWILVAILKEETSRIRLNRMSSNDEVKRKRGRKPKPKTEVVEKKIPKKRGRKPKQQAPDAGKQINNHLSVPIQSVINKPILIKLNIGRADVKRIDQQLSQFGKFVSSSRDPATREYSPQVHIPTAFNQEQSEQQFVSIKPKQTDNRPTNHAPEPKQNVDTDRSGPELGTQFCDEKEKVISLPSVYEKGIWPEKTNIRCWWCTLPFDSIPCFIPKKMRVGKYHVIGCFCSFNCSMAYNLYALDQNQYECLRQCALIHTMYTEIYGEIKEILPSPPKEVMAMYGGKLSVDQYRKKLKECNIQSYKLNYPPIVGINFELEHLSKTGSHASGAKTYVLERSKPPPNERKKLTRKFIKIIKD